MSRYIMLLFFTVFIVSCAQVKTHENEYVYVKGEGSGVLGALLKSVCEYSYVHSDISKNNKADYVQAVRESSSWEEWSSDKGYRINDLSVKIECVKSTVKTCKNNDTCSERDKAKMTKSYSRLDVKMNETERVNGYAEKIITDSNGNVLKNRNMLKSFVGYYGKSNDEKKQNCSLDCVIKALHHIGFSVDEIGVLEDYSQITDIPKRVGISSLVSEKSPSFVLSLKVDKIKTALSYDRYLLYESKQKNKDLDVALWEQFKSNKSHDELAAEISKMDDGGLQYDVKGSNASVEKHVKTKTANDRALWNKFKFNKAVDELKDELKKLEKESRSESK